MMPFFRLLLPCLLIRSASAEVRVFIERGSVISALPGVITPVFVGALVGPAITGIRLLDDTIVITWGGGSLETANDAGAEWIDTEDSSGEYSELVGAHSARFFRVRSP